MSEDARLVPVLTLREPAPNFTFHGEGGRLLLTIRASGELVFGPEARPEEAVRALMTAWDRVLPQSALRVAVAAERARIRAAVEAMRGPDLRECGAVLDGVLYLLTEAP